MAFHGVHQVQYSSRHVSDVCMETCMHMGYVPDQYPLDFRKHGRAHALQHCSLQRQMLLNYNSALRCLAILLLFTLPIAGLSDQYALS